MGWIPACAESTPQNAPQKHPSPYTERLGGIEKKCLGVLKRNTRGEGQDCGGNEPLTNMRIV